MGWAGGAARPSRSHLPAWTGRHPRSPLPGSPQDPEARAAHRAPPAGPGPLEITGVGKSIALGARGWMPRGEGAQKRTLPRTGAHRGAVSPPCP